MDEGEIALSDEGSRGNTCDQGNDEYDTDEVGCFARRRTAVCGRVRLLTLRAWSFCELQLQASGFPPPRPPPLFGVDRRSRLFFSPSNEYATLPVPSAGVMIQAASGEDVTGEPQDVVHDDGGGPEEEEEEEEPEVCAQAIISTRPSNKPLLLAQSSTCIYPPLSRQTLR